MIEIIDLLDPMSKYAFEERRAQKYHVNPHLGGVLQNRPFLYGSKVWVEKRFWTGVYSKRLIPNLQALNRKNKKFSLQILVGSEDEYRGFSSGVVLNDSTFWYTGPGLYGSTEFISLGSELPEDFEAESEEDSETSSEDEDSDIKRTWIVDPSNNFKIKRGPKLLNDRGNCPACAKMELNGTVYIIVAGGTKTYSRNGKIDPSCNTVEILDTSSPDEGWILGMPMHIIK